MTTLTRTLGPEDEALARLPRDDLVARLHAHRPTRLEAGGVDADRDAATDAAVRAARVLELLEAGEARVEHLL